MAGGNTNTSCCVHVDGKGKETPLTSKAAFVLSLAPMFMVPPASASTCYTTQVFKRVG